MWRVRPTRGDSAHTGRIPGRHKNGKYAAVTPARPVFQRHEAHAEGSDTAPTQKCRKSTVCRREQRVRRCRAPTLRKPFFCRNKPRVGLFRHSHSGRRVVIPLPHRSVEKMQNGSFYHLPQQGSRRNPAKRFRWEEDERQRARVLPLAAGRGIRRPLGRRPASRLSGLRRSRCPAKRTGRGMAPHPQAAGVSAETLLPASGGAASKGDQSPFEEPPALRGDERNHFRKVIQHEKRY